MQDDMRKKNVQFSMESIIVDSSGFEYSNPEIHYVNSFYYYFSDHVKSIIITHYQEDFIWHEIWQTSIHLFKVRWNDRELFSYDISLWNQYKYIAFNIFSYRVLIISYKILIITGISNEKWMN